jgi:hypothetical protein
MHACIKHPPLRQPKDFNSLIVNKLTVVAGSA